MKNQQNEIVKMHIQKEAIEEEIIKHNTKHFKQAHKSIIYRDKYIID